MGRVCAGTRKDGTRCGKRTKQGKWCWLHDPKRKIVAKSSLGPGKARNGGDDLSLRSEAAVIQGLIDESVRGLESDDSQAVWVELGGLARDFRTALKAEKKLDLAERMCSLVGSGAEKWRKVALLLEYIEFKRKLAESEQKRVKVLEENLDVKQAAELVRKVLSAIERCVPDLAIRQEIAKELGRVVRGG